MIQVGYLGAWGSSLDRSRLVNNAQPGPGGVQPRRPVQTIPFVPGTDLGTLPPGVTVASTTFPVGPINLLESSGKSQYNSVWILTKRTFSRGLSYMASYTYSDSLSDSPTFRSPNAEAEVPQNSFDPGAEWGPAGCDIRHRFVSSVIYKIPVLGDRWRVRRGDKIVARHFRRLAGVADLPVAERLPVHGQRLWRHRQRRIAAQRQPDSRQRRPRRFNRSRPSQRRHVVQHRCVRHAAAVHVWNGDAQQPVGPGLKKADLALDREIALSAPLKFHFRLEAFNLFNTVNYGTPNRFVNTPQFGTITEAATSARQIQFVFRATF